MGDFSLASPTYNRESNFNPLISVVICTYNRADRLIFALEGLCCQSLPIQCFEILVVDNASTDNTQQICTRYQEHLPNLRYIYEPVRGLSKARNTALQQAHGEYIAYLDDDAIPCEAWLQTILETFKTVAPTPVCVGGPIYPLWESPKPEWVPKEVEYLFSILDFGNQPQWLKLPKYPFGANMTFQRHALCKAGGFDEQLGRQGKNLLSGEEYLLYRTLVEQGRGLFYYSPQASVQHFIAKERNNLNWMLRRAYWQGRSTAVVARLLGKSLEREWWEMVRGIIKPKGLIAQLGSIVQTWRDRKARTAAQVQIAQSWGYLSQVWLRSLAWKLPVTATTEITSFSTISEAIR